MYQIRMPAGEFLDTEANLNLQFELNNQVFSSSDPTVIPGSFTFPASIPLSGKNKRLLGDPQLVTNARKRTAIEGVWVYLDGIPFFYGTLTIGDCDEKTAKISIVSNPVSQLKNIPLNTLDLGGDRVIGDAAAMLAHAKDTAQNPEDHDYVFCPIVNRYFLDEPTGDERCFMQNHFNEAAEVFQVADAYPIFMPFIKVDYLLERIFSGIDYSFSNQFQTITELRRLCLYNNRSMWTAAGMPTTLNLQNHVSKTGATEFIKKLAAVFNLGLFTNPFTKTIRLIPVRDIYRRAAKFDWTAYAYRDMTVGSEGNAPKSFDFEADGSDQMFAANAAQIRPADADVIARVTNIDELEANPDYVTTSGIYYIVSREGYYYYDFAAGSAFRYRLIYTELGPAPTRDSSDVFTMALSPLFDWFPRGDIFQAPASSAPGGPMPSCRIAGAVQYVSGSEVIKQEAEIPDRLLMYRGWQQNAAITHHYPQACTTPYQALGILNDEYSLRLQGDYGIYKQWWSTSLRDGKPVTLKFALPVGALIEFSFEDKIRVQNMDYFAKTLRINRVLSNHRVEVEAQLVSVI